jgi:hypothetical protein
MLWDGSKPLSGMKDYTTSDYSSEEVVSSENFW